jgi:hypothetical protein
MSFNRLPAVNYLLVVVRFGFARDVCAPVLALWLQVAFVGFSVQAIATRTTPLEGLSKHLSDPLGKNIT